MWERACNENRANHAPEERLICQAEMLHPFDVGVCGLLGLPAAQEVGTIPGPWGKARGRAKPWVHPLLGVHT